MITSRHRAVCAFLCAAALAFCITALAADSVWYQFIKVVPTKNGTMKATFYYNTTNRPDILNVPVGFAINDHFNVFNQTNNTDDSFFWKKQNAQGTRFKYQKHINIYASETVTIDTKKQYGTILLRSLSLQSYATNRTDYHSTRLQIADLDVTLMPWYQGFTHQAAMRYEDDLLWMRNFLFVYGTAAGDQLMVRGIARYNAYTNNPPVSSFPVALTIRGESDNSTIPAFTCAGVAVLTGKGMYTVTTGPLQGKFNFNNGQFTLKQRTPFTPGTANYQSNCNVFVTLKLGEPPIFEKSIAVRAKSVQKNRISY